MKPQQRHPDRRAAARAITPRPPPVPDEVVKNSRFDGERGCRGRWPSRERGQRGDDRQLHGASQRPDEGERGHAHHATLDDGATGIGSAT
jgi:hypothetical protein